MSGSIQTDGSFELHEYSVSSGDKGLDILPGNYRVSVSAAEIVDLEREEVRWLAPSRYADFRSSGIEVEISDNNRNLRINLTWEGDDAVAAGTEAAENPADAPKSETLVPSVEENQQGQKP